MIRPTILQALILCSFSVIHCMEMTKYEDAYTRLNKTVHHNLTKSAKLLHKILKLNQKDPDLSLAATKLFYEHKGDLNIQSPSGYTFLMEAVRKKNILLLEYLLEKKANPNIPTYDRTYPIHLAIEFDDYYCVNEKPAEINLEIVALLLKYGAYPNHQYPRYQVLPLDVARSRKKAIIIRELIKYGAKSSDEMQKESRESQNSNANTISL